jgi:hypothetical protein
MAYGGRLVWILAECGGRLTVFNDPDATAPGAGGVACGSRLWRPVRSAEEPGDAQDRQLATVLALPLAMAAVVKLDWRLI